MRRLPLGPIEAFVVVARSLSLVEAAREMNLTVPAMSRRIQLLERHLDVRLFHRLPRGLALTDAGSDYLRALGPAWDSVQAATEAATRRRSLTTIRLSVTPTFAANWLIPRLSRFHAGHPGMAVELETSAELVELEARPDLHCAIRLGIGPWRETTGEAFLPVDAYPVASPGYLETLPPLRRPGDLRPEWLIGSNHQPAFWQEWFRGAGLNLAADPRRGYDNLHLMYEAAAAGMGIAIGLDPVVRPYLESDRLARVLAAGIRLPRSFHLLHRPGDTAGPPQFSAFRTWLLAEGKAFLHQPEAADSRVQAGGLI